ncbi:MAG TPA: hypothetical protein VGI67_21545 [Thermoleophilaceae bacterium]|jgi:hypothetical protein
MNRAISSNFYKPIDAPPAASYAALTRLECTARLERAFAAMGVDDRIISAHRIQLAPRRAAGYAIVWRLAGGGRAEVSWTASVAGASEGSLLSIAVRAYAQDDESYEEMLTAWPLLGRIAELHARRTLAAVAELACQIDAEGEHIAAPATLVAAV